MTIDRRQFLAALAGLGAIAALPEHATDAEVDAAWAAADADAYTFLVADDGQIVDDETYEEPSREDLWCVKFFSGATAEELVDIVDACPPLRDDFEWHAYEARSELQSELGELAADERFRREEETPDENGEAPCQPDPATRRRTERRAAVARGRLQRRLDTLAGDEPWRGLILGADADALERYLDLAGSWFAKPPDHTDAEYRTIPTRAGGHAYEFFRAAPFAVCRALGVKVVEGEHPGSSYYAAELRQPIRAANAAARKHGIPIRFRRC